ncbi:MAG TPA: 6-phosphogluconolactonase, partial [Solirubrobacterales bacterium]|nr:6-phosphogluconolactonase [Solirubrobacterales bacterium]
MAIGLEVAGDEKAASRRAAELIAAAGDEAVGERGRFAFAMSGGRSPWTMLAILGELEEMPWAETELFQVDERIASPGSEDRNLTHMVLGLSMEHQPSLRPMPVTNRDLDAAAHEYETSLPERLDVVHLGLGPDGHTASLVPGDPVLEV